jgi:Spy/CpxP family protein refolding chaperone
MIKRILSAGILLLGLAGAVGAQEPPLPQVMERLGLSRQEQQQVERLIRDYRETIQESRLELEVIKAQLRRLLFDRNVDMEEVKRLLRQSLEWEYKERLAQIELQVELRKLLSEEQYARLRQFWTQRRQDGAE